MHQGSKIRGAGSNAARRRCLAAPSDLPKSGGAAAPPAPPLGASLVHTYVVPLHKLQLISYMPLIKIMT